MFTDHASGALTQRPQLTAALEQLRPGDTLAVRRLDRLGRSTSHLIQTVTALEERGVGFASLTEAIDTTTPGGSSDAGRGTTEVDRRSHDRGVPRDALRPPREVGMPQRSDAVQFRAELVRRGRRGLLICAAAGLGLVVLLGVGVGLLLVFVPPTGGHGLTDGQLAPRIAQGLLLIVLGAGLGRMQADTRAADDLRDVVGSRVMAARVRRIVFKGLGPASEEERDRAAAWAPLAALSIGHMTGSTAIFSTAITADLLLQAVTLSTDFAALHTLQIVVLILLVVTAAVVCPLHLQRARRAADCIPAALLLTDEGTSSVSSSA